MEKLIEYLKSKLSELFSDIKIVNITYNKTTNCLVVKVVYRNTYKFDDVCRNNLRVAINEFLKIPNLQIEIKSKKSLVDETAIKELINYFINKNYASIFATMQNEDLCVNIGEELVNIKVKFLEVFKTFLENKKFGLELKSFLERNHFQNFNVELETKKGEEELDSVLNEQTKIFENVIKSEANEIKQITYELQNVEDLIGQKVESLALASSSLTTSCTNATIAGEINFITKKTYISKRKKSDGEEKVYYNFMLNDGYGKIHCVYFPTKESVEKFELIEEKQQIAVCGDVEEFNGRQNFKIKGIATCVLPPKEVEIVEEKAENKDYKFIRPQPYINLSQATLFDVAVENNNKFLKENDCVVFDLETTGLEATVHEIIEIGAVKLKDGKLVETFSCLVKPKELIPEEITAITGITNEMVANSYNIKDVLQDFYKFTRNSVLVAYNIAFDYKFIYLAGVAQGYNFNNKQIDAMVLAKTKLKGLKNYKLKTVVANLNVPLENAHRAVNDAVATAEAFIKLVDSNTVV